MEINVENLRRPMKFSA